MDHSPSLAVILRRLTLALEDIATGEARIEAEVLLRHHTGLARAQLLTRGGDPLDPEVEAAVHESLRRRLRGEPLAYITGHREFFGLEFAVDARVLIPRPETELLVETALEWVKAASIESRGTTSPPAPLLRGERRPVPLPSQGRGEGLGSDASPGTNLMFRRPPETELLLKARRDDAPPVTFADIGTGSGAIAVSLAVNAPVLHGYAVDASTGAIEVARHNAAAHGVAGRIEFLEGDLLAPLPGPVDMLLANLPYVRQDQLPLWCGVAQVELAWEPLAALDGGLDGLDVIRRLLADAPRYLRPGGLLLLEIGSWQGDEALQLAASAFPKGTVTLQRDLAGLSRMVRVGFW
ncbi:MAG: peptide chain release factor N(5)-glutamine methyltransferase [Dehalococcoidia bacterium]|nr:peptide chain release factor N(5)-glutamine methyltransferase [Dehalococcoidia bacterium]